MNTFDLGRILEEVHWDDYAEFDNPQHNIKSLQHRLRMRRIFNHAVEKQSGSVKHTRMKLSPQMVLILLVLIFTAIITAAAIVVWYGNIYGQRHSDNTELFAAVEGAPKTIEEIYEITDIPEGYVLTDITGGIGDTYAFFVYENDNKSILFRQFTRESFNVYVDSERGYVSKTQIMDMNAVILQIKENGNDMTEIYLDCDKYILEISTNLSKDETIQLLKSAKF